MLILPAQMPSRMLRHFIATVRWRGETSWQLHNETASFDEIGCVAMETLWQQLTTFVAQGLSANKRIFLALNVFFSIIIRVLLFNAYL